MHENKNHTSQSEEILAFEVDLAVSLSKDGLAALQRSESYLPIQKRFTYMLLLSTGLERFMKVMICLHTP